MKKTFLICCAFFAAPVLLHAMDEMTVYDLLSPETSKFAIRYDTSALKAGSKVYYNIIRPGSEASDEKVFDRATGKELPFVMATGKEAKADGQADPETTDDTGFIKVTLPHPVPRNGEFRLRILKTYKDPKSYYLYKDRLIFERSLSIKRNVILLPKGYELVFSSVPVMVSTETDGRIKISMVNDRADELEVKIVGAKTGGAN